jgi:two-component system sensor histidine kinase KdpD
MALARAFANMSDVRPNPDELLAQVEAQESARRLGTLKIFFGYAAGVGKTYAMLENAHAAKAAGREVVVGYIEPHARPETQALTSGLEALPANQIEHRGTVLREFDVDGALARRPELLLVDELAHTNVHGSRHSKRWQDVEELLAAGVNVWTTLNVQHIESLNDVVGQVTGIVVRETIPDSVFEAAAELELVDLPPDELLARLQAGKVYIPEQAQRAIQHFFQKPNLSALRELSMRQAARRVHTEVESARRQKAAQQPWATADRLLVCVGPSPTTARVIRTAKRMAAALDAPWLALSVDVAGRTLSSLTKSRVADHFRLAERLGAETVTISGLDVAGSVLDYARSRNVTKIFMGKTTQVRWARLLFGNVVDEVLERSGDIDVYVIHGEKEPEAKPHAVAFREGVAWQNYAGAAGVTAASGILAAALRALHVADAEANTVMLFLAGVACAAYRFGRGPAILASILAVLGFDFFFVPPVHAFAVADAQYIVTFGVMLAIGLVISTLTSRLRAQVESTRLRERRTAALYQLGKQLSSLYGGVFLVAAAGDKIAEMTGGEVAVYLSRPEKLPQLVFGHETSIASDAMSVPVAEWVSGHDQVAGAGTNTLPGATAVFLPLVGSQRTLGAIAIKTAEIERLHEPEQRRLLEACASQLALALERDQLAIEAAEARIQAEAEQVRSTLLSSVSHDFKTPLAVIAGASSSMLESGNLSDASRRQLLRTIVEEATRLDRLLENILQMSRLDAGAIQPNKQWHVVEEVVGTALQRTRDELAGHVVEVHVPSDLPLVSVDGLLIEQVLVNLLENANRYTPAGTRIAISAAADGDWLRLSVSDQGPGLPAGAEKRVFEKFYRGSSSADGSRGSGLGLAICQAIAKAHGGSISAANGPGGAEFTLRLPVGKNAPRVVVE